MNKSFIVSSIIAISLACYCGIIIFLYLTFFNEDISFVEFLLILLVPVAVSVVVICRVLQRRKAVDKSHDRK